MLARRGLPVSRPPGARAEAAARLIAVTDAKIAKYDTEYPGPEPEAEPDPERDRLDADLAEIRADAEAAEKAAAPVRDRGAFAAEGDHDGRLNRVPPCGSIWTARPGTGARLSRVSPGTAGTRAAASAMSGSARTTPAWFSDGVCMTSAAVWLRVSAGRQETGNQVPNVESLPTKPAATKSPAMLLRSARGCSARRRYLDCRRRLDRRRLAERRDPLQQRANGCDNGGHPRYGWPSITSASGARCGSTSARTTESLARA
jgi:hypothetical protein